MIILDLDGCTSDDRARRIHINGANTDWDAYHRGMGNDKMCHVKLLRLRERTDIIVVTGRPERYRAETELWLSEGGVKPHDVIMRPDDDYTPAPVFKKKAAATLLALGYAIDSAYDDRPDIVEAYRELGIRASVLTVEMADG